MCKEFGQLPFSGGVLEQPARLMYVFQYISAATSERQILDNKKSQSEQKRGMRNAGKR